MPKNNRSWDQLVSAGRQAAQAEGDAKWALGDLALEAEPMGSRGGEPTGALERLREYGEAIGVELETLRDYRAVAHSWPDGARAPLDASWTAHRLLAGVPDRKGAMKVLLAEQKDRGRRLTTREI